MLRTPGSGGGQIKVKAGRPIRRLLQLPGKRDDGPDQCRGGEKVGRCGMSEKEVSKTSSKVLA